MEWVLVLTLNIVSDARELRDVSPSVLPGFQTRERCEQAARTLSESVIRMVGRAREQRGVQRNTWTSFPSVNYECVQVRK